MEIRPIARLREWAGRLRQQVAALQLAATDPRTPRAARWLIVVVIAYALSPIDLIPDFIPVLGYLDDLLLVPAGLWLALRLIPPEVWVECRARAANAPRPPRSRLAGFVIVALWIVAAAGAGLWMATHWSGGGPAG